MNVVQTIHDNAGASTTIKDDRGVLIIRTRCGTPEELESYAEELEQQAERIRRRAARIREAATDMKEH